MRHQHELVYKYPCRLLLSVLVIAVYICGGGEGLEVLYQLGSAGGQIGLRRCLARRCAGRRMFCRRRPS